MPVEIYRLNKVQLEIANKVIEMATNDVKKNIKYASDLTYYLGSGLEIVRTVAFDEYAQLQTASLRSSNTTLLQFNLDNYPSCCGLNLFHNFCYSYLITEETIHALLDLLFYELD